MIKKILGFMLIIIGIFLENIGIFGIGNSSGKLSAASSLLQPELFDTYRNEHEKSLALGGACMAIGLIILIIGLVLVATKTTAQKERELELKILKSKGTTE